MKKIILLTSLLLIGLLLLTGCGENKKTASLFGLSSTVSATATATTQEVALATSAEVLYDVTKIAAGVGTTTYGVRGRSYVLGTDMGDLGQADDDGEYTVTNTGVAGIVCKLKFLHGTDVVYFNMAGSFGSSNNTLLLYSDQDLSASNIDIATVPQGPEAVLVGWPRYVPTMFSKVEDDKPLAWFTINDVNGLLTLEADLTAFINDNFPDSMSNHVTGTVGGNIVSLAMTSAMTDKPSDTHPSIQTGGGTITLVTGEILIVVFNDVAIGATGPIGGTQTFTSTSGLSGTMTFHSDHTMTGTISQSGVAIATISIAADGTGTLTDVATGVVTAI
jgi:hypothetical protein